MKTLNLDSLAVVKRSVTLNDVDHPVKDMSVEDFIAAQLEAKKLDGLTEVTIVDNLEASIAHLTRVIPSLTETQLRTLSMPQVLALVQFVNGTLEEEALIGAGAAAPIDADLPEGGDEGK